MHRISARQDALLTELRDLAQTQQDILREVHPDAPKGTVTRGIPAYTKESF
jgi:hypothetical protein